MPRIKPPLIKEKDWQSRGVIADWMESNNLQLKDLARIWNVHASTAGRRMNAPENITIREIRQMSRLGLTDQQIVRLVTGRRSI